MNRNSFIRAALVVALCSIRIAGNAVSAPRTGGPLVLPAKKAPNQPPIVYATDFSAELSCVNDLAPVSILLSGSASDDGKPFGIVIYEWSLVGGDASKVRFQGNRFAREVYCQFAAAGDYEMLFAAADGQYRSERRVFVRVGAPRVSPKSGTAVAGVVSYRNRPASGAVVEMVMNGKLYGTTWTDSRGRYSFPSAPVGDFVSIRAERAGHTGLAANCARFYCDSANPALGCNVALK